MRTKLAHPADPVVTRILDVLDEVAQLNASLRRITAPAIVATAGAIAIAEIVARAARPAQIIAEITHA